MIAVRHYGIKNLTARNNQKIIRPSSYFKENSLSSVHPPLELGLLPWSPPQDNGRKWSPWGEETKAQDGGGHKRAAPSALQVF